ncbi:hypothetical protein [Candidatus Rhodobacter oscarellae]|uniref:hypothetical protein n=1 Tax=Candidatus Rhodobacter oscarellae TaxID=1675527 RepID=UPI00067156F9|nr:hypothetical protein [Candidatus Rhodobacter lobularis]
MSALIADDGVFASAANGGFPPNVLVCHFRFGLGPVFDQSTINCNAVVVPGRNRERRGQLRSEPLQIPTPLQSAPHKLLSFSKLLFQQSVVIDRVGRLLSSPSPKVVDVSLGDGVEGIAKAKAAGVYNGRKPNQFIDGPLQEFVDGK